MIINLLDGQFKNKTRFLPRITCVDNQGVLPFSLRRLQYPARLAVAMTINKAQGQTLKKMGLFLPCPCFAHGQLYTAFSRVGNPENISVLVKDHKYQGKIKEHDGTWTRNVVYQELLNSQSE